MRKLAAVIIALFILRTNANAQGCVAIRSTGTSCTKLHAETAKGWTFNTSYRYFRSFRHFVGTEEQKQRASEHTEVINWQHAVNLELVRQFDNRWSLGLYLPILANTRSSLYEHGGNNGGPNARHETHSFGLGDIRIAAYRWLLDPASSMKGNIQTGLGIKFPTGDYRYQDFFYKNDSTKILGPVDQSIQLGDGGTGFTVEINAYYNFTTRLSVYGNFYYLFNPREQNGVSTARGGTVSSSAVLYGSSTMSVPDQFMLRAGANFSFDRLTLSAGVRDECLPSKDLVGGSSGFRRPGYIVSFEPAISYEFKKFSAYASLPVAVKRDRTQSVPDKLRTEATGVYTHGDAAFADYTINIGFSFKL
jgi:hypothetical protein